MIPFQDNIPSVRSPVFVLLLIVVNTVVFLYQSTMSPAAEEQFVFRYGLIPREFSQIGKGPVAVEVPGERLLRRTPLGVVVDQQEPRQVFFQGTFTAAVLPLLTSMFLHGSWMHLIGNMWFLWLFGDNVEDRLGRARFTVLYLASGVGAGLCQVMVNWDGLVPMIGASGAVAGVLGAYFVTYPHARVLTLVPFFYFFWPIVELPAIVFLGLWFLMQFFNATAALGAPGAEGGVAWWAHVSGFLVGGILMKLCAPTPRIRHRPKWGELIGKPDWN